VTRTNHERNLLALERLARTYGFAQVIKLTEDLEMPAVKVECETTTSAYQVLHRYRYITELNGQENEVSREGAVLALARKV